MTCREARSRLSDELDHSLSTRGQRELTAHLAVCSACREERRLLATMRQLLSRYGASRCPVDFTHLAERLAAQSERRRPPLRLRYGLAVAAVGLAALGGLWLHPWAPPSLPAPAPQRVVVRDVAEVEELHRSFALQQSMGERDGLVLFAPDWVDRAR